MKLNLKLTSLLLGTCVLAGPTVCAVNPRDQRDSAETSASAVKVTEAAAEDADGSGKQRPPYHTGTAGDRFLLLQGEYERLSGEHLLCGKGRPVM